MIIVDRSLHGALLVPRGSITCGEAVSCSRRKRVKAGRDGAKQGEMARGSGSRPHTNILQGGLFGEERQSLNTLAPCRGFKY